MRPPSWPVLLPPSCPCCLPGRPLSPAAAGLRLLSSPLVPVRSLVVIARFAAFCPLGGCWFPPLLFGLASPCVCLVFLCVVCLGPLFRFCLLFWLASPHVSLLR